MALACSVNVNAKNGKKSRLFYDLLSHTGNRELSKQLWSIAQEESLMEEFDGLERDSNGEITYESFSKATNLTSLLDRQHQINEEARALGIVDKNGAPLFFDSISTALDRAIQFNEGKDDFVAEVKLDGKPFVQIREKTLEDSTANNQMKFKRDLNNRLLDMLHRMGFDVSFMEDSHKEGIFNPMFAGQNASNLKTVIQISKGEIGEEAFPEEMSHLIIAGLKNDIRVERLRASVTQDVIEEVLGDQYEDYRKQYSDSADVDAYLQEEAMGKMLADALVNGIDRSPLLRRIWNRSKELFARGDTAYIDDQINGLKVNLEAVVEVVNNPEELESIIDKDAILASKPLYKLASELRSMRDIALEGERLLAKRLQLYKLDNEYDDAKRERRNEDMEEMNELRTLISNRQYEASCFRILDDTLRQIIRLNNDMERLAEFRDTNNPSIKELAAVARQINKIKQFNDAYTPLIDALLSIDVLVANGEISLDEGTVEEIQKIAQEVSGYQTTINKSQQLLRFRVIKNWVGMTYGEERLKAMASNPEEAQSLEMICRRAERDITSIGQNLSSLGDSGNPLLNVLHAIVARQQAQRNNMINEYYSFLQASASKLKEAGHNDSSFVFAKDKNGVPTGRFESIYDFDAYERAKQAYIDELKENEEMTDREFMMRVRMWEQDNQQWYVVDESTGRTELLPDLEKYKNEHFQEGWDQAMKDYYDDIIEYKAMLDSLLPIPAQHLFHAPQVDKSVVESLDVTDPQGSLKRLWGKIKDHYFGTNDNVRTGVNPDQLASQSDDTDLIYTDDEFEFSKSSFLDYSGQPVKTVPVYYVKDLEDMNLLSTDATKAMISYACMAVNYGEMTKIADLALLLKEHVREEYVVSQRKAGNKIFEKFNIIDKDYLTPYEVKGENTRIYKALNDFLEANMFGGAHEDMAVLKNGLKTHAVFEDFRSYVSKNALGFNLFSGLSNVTMGEAQMTAEAVGGYHFNVKDLLWAHKEYNKLLGHFIYEAGSTHKTNKLDLLMNAFNADEEFFRSIQEDIYNKNAFMRVMGKFNSLFLQTAGEHMMHAVGMLAILHHIQTNHGSLYDAIEIKSYNGAYQVVLKEGTTIDAEAKGNKGKNWYTNLSKSSDGLYHVDEDNPLNMNTLFNDVSVYINRVNAGLHGGYAQIEKGTANRKWFWRLLTQFRQWMPGTYNELYHGEYYDAIYGINRSGAFNTVWKFIKDLAYDVKRGEVSLALNWDHLNDFEKSQCKKAFFTSSLFIVMSGLAMLARGLSDKDRPWASKMLRYQIERLRLETGALVPNITMLENFSQILQSPMAGIDGVNNILNALKFWQAADEIESGRYEGWSVWERNLFKAIPYHNIVKAMDMKDDNYMFRMFDSK